MMGMYAENLVAQEICKGAEAIEVAYYREKAQEVDFVITYGGNRYLPLEVKYRKSEERATGLRHFMKKFKLSFGVVITRDRNCRFSEGVLYLPLRYFLLTN
jgi:predicted AAA+ superfamily ATPase